MGFLRQSSSTPVQTPDYTGVQIQTSSSALPIPIVYGLTPVAPNILWTGAFQAVPQYSQSTGGKGGLLSASSGSQMTGYDYKSAIVLGLCEGPISNLGTVFDGQSTEQPSAVIDTFRTGTTPQAPWSYLVANDPNQALAYAGTAIAVAASFDLGSSASIGSLSFEIAGLLYGSGTINGHDADPAQIVGDFLTNAQYGVGFPAASIDATALYGSGGDASYQTYCKASGLVFSPAITDQEAANSILARWLQITNSTAVWSGGRLRIIPYGDEAVAGAQADGSTVTYAPTTFVVYDLGDDDFVAGPDADPVVVTRSDASSIANVVSLEVLERENQYGPTTITARDQATIELFGLHQGSTITAHEYCNLPVARTAAQLVLQRGLYIRNTYAFKLSWDYCLLEPMDLVTLSDPGLGLARAAVRITEIAEDAGGLLSVTAEEYPGSVGSGGPYAVDNTTTTPINRAVVPAPVNPPLIFEPPSDLTGGAPQIRLGVCGGTGGLADPNWGGAIVYASTDDATYTRIGIVSQPSRMGVLTAAIEAPPGAASDALAVSFAQSGATIVAGAQPILLLVDHEIMSFATVTLTGTNAYSLGGLARALYGRNGAAHAVGAPVLVLDASLFAYALPQTLIGAPLWLKLASVNVFGASPQDLSTCTAYPYTPVGSGLFGPVSQAIAAGTSLDEGLASAPVTSSDDDGLASDPYVRALDMGLAS